MESLRSFWRSHGLLAALVVAAALLARSAVPGGYMVAQSPGGLQISFCSSTGGAPSLDREALATIRHLETIVAQDKAGDAPAQDAAKVCPYAVLSLGSLAGADPLQLAAALAFVLALGFAVRSFPAPARPTYFRPPMRGPPALS